jgi:hypothetical protein
MSDINVQTFSGKVNVTNNLLVGTSHLFVDTVNNKVGITTASPDAGLHVNSNAYVNTDFRVGTSIVMNDTDGQITAGSFVGNGSGLSNVNSDSGLWTGAGTGNVYLSTSTHKVGIGTSEPNKKLHIYTDTGEGNTQLHLESADRYSTIQMLDDNGAILFGNDRGAMRFITGYDTYLAGGSEAMRILGNGNVGIGTNDPQQKLEVHGNILLGENNINSFIHGGANMTMSSDTDVMIVSDANLTSGTPNGNVIFGAGSAIDMNNSRDFTYAQAYPNSVPRIEHMRILGSNGNVGIGTNDPDAKLHVNGNTIIGSRGGYSGYTDAQLTLGGSHNTAAGYNTSNLIKLLISGGDNDGASPYYIMCEDENGNDIFYLKGSTTDGGAANMYMDANIGVGLTNPGLINNSPNVNRTVQVIGRYVVSEPNDDEHWSISTNNNLNFKRSINGEGYINAADISFQYGNYIDLISFTGQHRGVYIKNIPPKNAHNYEGLIVCANCDEYESVNGVKRRGNEAITVNEAVPLLRLSCKENDKTCFGVISDSEDSDTRTQTFGNFKSFHHKMKGDEQIFINSLGEGAIWVVNTNGSLESGDYVTTSNVPGYGMKQNYDEL